MNEARIYLDLPLHAYPGTTNARDHLPSCVPPLLPATGWVGSLPKEHPLSTPSWDGRGHGGTGISTSCASTTPFGLALGPTNPTRTDLPSETLDIRGLWFSHSFRYSCQHSHFRSLHHSFPYGFNAPGTLAYCSVPTYRTRSFGGRLKPRYIFGAESLDQ